MKEIILQGYQTYTGHALEKANYDFNRDGRKGVKKVIVLLTDGRSNDPNAVKKNSDLLRASGVTTLAIGVGQIKEDELKVTTIFSIHFGLLNI